jgi:probable rRNA maturation factor
MPRHRARVRAQPRLSFTVTDGRGRLLRADGLASWLSRVAPGRAAGHIGVALVTDAQARALNRRYRRRDYATDVLSFPADEPASRQPAGAGSHPPARVQTTGLPRFLGDIVIARGVARRQARQAAHDERTEVRILALHGMLHLLGYDHHRDRGQMAGMERRLRRKGGLREGLIERARR